MTRFLIGVMLIGVGLIGCAKHQVARNSAVAGQPGVAVAGFVMLYSWGNEGCGACKKELGDVSAFLQQHPDIRNQVIPVLLVPSGDPDEEWSPAQALQFHDTYAPDFVYQRDEGWVLFNKYVADQGTPGNLPADIIIDKKGNATVYTSQTTTPTADLIIKVLQGLVAQ